MADLCVYIEITSAIRGNSTTVVVGPHTPLIAAFKIMAERSGLDPGRTTFVDSSFEPLDPRRTPNDYKWPITNRSTAKKLPSSIQVKMLA